MSTQKTLAEAAEDFDAFEIRIEHVVDNYFDVTLIAETVPFGVNIRIESEGFSYNGEPADPADFVGQHLQEYQVESATIEPGFGGAHYAKLNLADY